jgi:hypothetical protein
MLRSADMEGSSPGLARFAELVSRDDFALDEAAMSSRMSR